MARPSANKGRCHSRGTRGAFASRCAAQKISSCARAALQQVLAEEPDPRRRRGSAGRAIGGTAGRAVFGDAGRAVGSTCLVALPPGVLQHVADFEATFHGRVRFSRACSALRLVEWRWAPPLLCSEDFGGLGLGDMGACAVAEALAKTGYPPLLRLFLGGNNIGDRGAAALASALSRSSAPMRRLYLEGNKIGSAGARALSAMMASHKTLKEIDLCSNRISPVARSELRCSTDRQQVFFDWDLPSPTFMSSQSDINAKMRCILNDWLTDVFFTSMRQRPPDNGGLSERKLFLAFGMIDRFLSRRPVPRTRLQLLGVACAFAAARHGEPGGERDPESLDCARWLASVTDGTFAVDDVISMAAEVRSALDEGLDQPTVYTLLLRYLCRTGWRLPGLLLAEYLLYLTVLDYSMLQCSPQAVTAGVVALVHESLGVEVTGALPDWRQRLLRSAGVDERDVEACKRTLAVLHSRARDGDPFLKGHSSRLAAYRRYAEPQMNSVSKYNLDDTESVLQTLRHSEQEQSHGPPGAVVFWAQGGALAAQRADGPPAAQGQPVDGDAGAQA